MVPEFGNHPLIFYAVFVKIYCIYHTNNTMCNADNYFITLIFFV